MEGFAYKKIIGLNDDITEIRTEVFIKEQEFNDEFDETAAVDKIVNTIKFK